MKLHQSLIIAAILSIFVIPSLTYALTPKRTLEQYANLTREATEQGNYLRLEELAQDMSKDYKGEIAEINAKGYLFNLYQGKCGRAISNGFPHPSASDENLPKCRALTNMQKTIDMAEELIEDLEAYLNSGKPLLAEEKEWIYGQISYLSKRLGSLYSKGKYVNKNESKALKYQKLYEKYEQLSQ